MSEATPRAPHRWEPITDLPASFEGLASPELPALVQVWKDQSKRLKETQAYKTFLDRMRRELAIETGIIERLYTMDRGITRLLIEKGIDEIYIPHGATNKPVASVIALIKDQELAVEAIFEFVANLRALSTSYVKELHQILTSHQEHVDAVDTLGKNVTVSLRRGDWKKLPNHPSRADGWIHEYCPPEQVASEMDRLINWHGEHLRRGVPSEVEAAWLHHRFTQIHPFQDGNGRVARCLATMVFLKAEWFPLVIKNEDRAEYISALEESDRENLVPLIQFFVARQKRAFIQVLSLSEEVLRVKAPQREILRSATEILERRKQERQHDVHERAEALHIMATDYLNKTAKEVTDTVRQVDQRYRAKERYAKHGTDRDYYHRYQVIQCAQMMDYFANTSLYRSWITLQIIAEHHTEILVSFHGIGREPRGILVCSAMAYQRESLEKDETRIDQIEPLCDNVFEITYAEPLDAMRTRFMKWLDDVVVAGLSYWRKRL